MMVSGSNGRKNQYIARVLLLVGVSVNLVATLLQGEYSVDPNYTGPLLGFGAGLMVAGALVMWANRGSDR